MNNECDHCRAQRVGIGIWELKLDDESFRRFCGLDCLYNWARDEWCAAVAARKPRGAVGHFGTQILEANR